MIVLLLPIVVSANVPQVTLTLTTSPSSTLGYWTYKDKTDHLTSIEVPQGAAIYAWTSGETADISIYEDSSCSEEIATLKWHWATGSHTGCTFKQWSDPISAWPPVVVNADKTLSAIIETPAPLPEDVTVTLSTSPDASLGYWTYKNKTAPLSKIIVPKGSVIYAFAPGENADIGVYTDSTCSKEIATLKWHWTDPAHSGTFKEWSNGIAAWPATVLEEDTTILAVLEIPEPTPTGDFSSLVPWLILLALSSAGIALYLVFDKRKSNVK